MAFEFAVLYGAQAVLGGPSGTLWHAGEQVNVYNRGTSTPATLYTNRLKSATAANPVTIDAVGNLHFYIDPGEYEYRLIVGAGEGPAVLFSVASDPLESSPADVSDAIAAIEAELEGLANMPANLRRADDYTGSDVSRINAAMAAAYADAIASGVHYCAVFLAPRVWDLSGGTLQTTNDCRAMIPIPDALALDNVNMTIELFGASGTVVRTFDGSFTYNGTSGVPSLIGAASKVSRIDSYTGGNGVFFKCHHIDFDAPSNPSIAMIDVRSCSGADIHDINMSTNATPTVATHQTAIGVLLPKSGNAGRVSLRRLDVNGFYGCHSFSEHASVEDVRSRNVAIHAFVTGMPSFHAAHFGRINCEAGDTSNWCSPVLSYLDFTSGPASPPSTWGPIDITIDLLDIENRTNGDLIGHEFVLDANNKFHGVINVSRVVGDVGNSSEPLFVLGCENLLFLNTSTIAKEGRFGGLPVFNIESYGAKVTPSGDFSVDSTAGLTSAINNAIGYGGGVILAPTPITQGSYKLTGNLLTGGDGQYAQVRIPHVAAGASKAFLFFAGPTDVIEGGGNNSGGPNNGYAVFETNKTGSYNATYGWPSVIGAPDVDKSSHRSDPNYFTNIHVQWGSIAIRQPSNPSLCGLNLETCDTVDVKSIYTYTATIPSTPCTHPTAIGMLLPTVQNHAYNKIGTFQSYGHYAGMNLVEHLKAEYTEIVLSVVALPVTRAFYHVAKIDETALEGNQYLIAGLNPSTGVTDIPANTSVTSGARTNGAIIEIDAMMIQDDITGGAFEPIKHIKDGNNLLTGYVDYGRIIAEYGPAGGLKATGCQQLMMRDLYDPTSKATPPVGPQVLGALAMPGAHDDFSRRDSLTLGNTSHGEAHWGGVVGQLGVRFGQLWAPSTAEHYSIIETGVSDSCVSGEWPNVGTGSLIFRYKNPANFLYWKPSTVSGGGLYKVVAGVATRLDSFTLAFANGDRFDVSYIGSTIKVFRTTAAGAMTLLGTVIDSTHITETQVGARATTINEAIPHFSYGQLAYDDFTRADAALGTSALGLTWIQTEAGVVRVISNAAGATSATEAKAVIPTGICDGWICAKFPVLPNGSSALLIFRYGDNNNYMAWQPSGGIYRVSGGTFNRLDNLGNISAANANDDIHAVKFDKAHIQVWRKPSASAPILLASVYEPFQQKNPFHGIRLADTTSRIDDFMVHPLTNSPRLA